MQINFLHEILSTVAGRQAGDIVNLLVGKKNVNEFIIAKKLKLTINQTRNILYKLSDSGLVGSTRKKDKRKGWYTYFWTLNTEKSLELLEKNVTRELENYRAQLKSRAVKRYYVCNTCKTEVSEETALLHNFICSECGEVYSLQEDKKISVELQSKIKKLEASLLSIQQELGLIREKESKRVAKETAKNSKKKKVKKPAKKTKKKKVKKPGKKTKKKRA